MQYTLGSDIIDFYIVGGLYAPREFARHNIYQTNCSVFVRKKPLRYVYDMTLLLVIL